MQPAPWKVRIFAGIYFIAYSGVAAWGWHEFQRGFAISCYVGAALMLVAAFFIPKLMVALVRGRIPESWRKRNAG
jgi:hypothetical protein